MVRFVVHEIQGECSVYEEDDEIVIEGPEIVMDKTDSLCTHALSSLLHYVPIFEKGDPDPVELGLTKQEDEENAYLQCLDPGKPYTEGGTVVFRIEWNSSDDE